MDLTAASCRPSGWERVRVTRSDFDQFIEQARIATKPSGRSPAQAFWEGEVPGSRLVALAVRMSTIRRTSRFRSGILVSRCTRA
jgi:hypothetical protein